ncbi:cell division ATP-binding protein FtsE [Intrasporangium oryzae]|uniref:cell division ATP-binding protein FtsE n=1 Tax=Intrasporangium oryzae TaxID=412687 RepID=UPI0004B8D63F|nr:cell division ATP-binding protein FtsE [Intrasporangium oryzae]
MILFDHVTKTYPRTKRPALADVSLEVPRGQFVFVVGKSGSGKSTMLQLAIKEQDPTEGTILVGGRDLAELPERKVPALRREIGCVFQDFRLLPNKTVFQNVAYALQVLGSSRSRIRQIVPETLELVGLAGKEKRLPHQLSGGEQQRVAIARAFVNRPPILLADEPTGNLDPATSLEIVQLLDRINRTGTTVVMATHDTVTVDAMRKRVIELDDGVVIRDQETGEYTTGALPRVVVQAPAAPDSAEAATKGADERVDERVDEPTEGVAADPTDQPAEETAAEPAAETVGVPEAQEAPAADVPERQPADEAAAAPVDDTAPEPTTEPTPEPTTEPTTEPTPEPERAPEPEAKAEPQANAEPAPKSDDADDAAPAPQPPVRVGLFRRRKARPTAQAVEH